MIQNLCDVLIVGRGGGSIEDLWAFNEEIVARAIFESRIPIISAVGHETDTTIADYVADLRAPTPTAAAELSVPNQQELHQRILTSKSYLHQIMTSKLTLERNRLKKLQNSYPLATPERLYRPFTEKIINLDMRLSRSSQVLLMKKRNELQKLDGTIKMFSPKNAIQYYGKQLDQTTNLLTRSVFKLMTNKKESYLSTIRTLEALNPLKIMNRGFSVTFKENEVIKSVSQLSANDEITVQFHDGEAKAKIINTQVNPGGSK